MEVVRRGVFEIGPPLFGSSSCIRIDGLTLPRYHMRRWQSGETALSTVTWCM